MKAPTVDIVIPTLCAAERAAGLRRAIDSVLAQRDVEARVILAVNGDRWDAHLLAEVTVRPGVTVVRLSGASLPAAIHGGRCAVSADYFGFLDDDDEYLPGSLAPKVGPMLADPDVDFVAANGWRMLGGQREAVMVAPSEIARAPLETLMRYNWLLSCAGLFRSRAVGATCFQEVPRYLEWTYIGLVLASRHRVAVVAEPAYVVHETTGSLSRRRGYLSQCWDVYPRLLALPLPHRIQRALLRKRTAIQHALSCMARRDGNRRLAWRHHLHSLMLPYGLRYLSYTRHLVADLFRPHVPAGRLPPT